MERTFENWLVVSDIDGTLNNKIRKLPRRNYNAIKEFTERGGNFTLASGRLQSSLERNYNVNICIARDSIKSQRIYGNFTRDEQTIEEIIKNICTVSGISYSIKGKEITLY